MFYSIKFSHLKFSRLAGGTPTRPRHTLSFAHATPRSAPARVSPIGSCTAAPPSCGCALAHPALRRSNMAASASVCCLGRRVSGLRAGGLGAPPGVRSLSVSPQVLACSWELPCAWRALHTSAVCAKVSAVGRPAGWGSGGGGWLPRDRPFAPRTGRRESVWPRGTSR